MVSSVMGFITAPGEAAYNASKAFDLHFGESLWGELRTTPVDVITVCPAGMQTDFFLREGFSEADRNRMWRLSNSPERIASATLRNLGRKAVWAPPLSRLLGCGAKFAPRWVTTLVAQFVTDRIVTFYSEQQLETQVD